MHAPNLEMMKSQNWNQTMDLGIVQTAKLTVVYDELSKLESDNGSWYCTNCKADCDLCSGAILNSHKAVQCDKCTMWVHNECSYITETLYETAKLKLYLDLPEIRILQFFRFFV